MSQPSGMKTVTCPICRKRYKRTNWMRRKWQYAESDSSIVLSDSHQIACDKKKLTSQEPAHAKR